MAPREEWRKETIEVEGNRFPAYVMYCDKCGSTDYLTATAAFAPAMAAQMLPQKFITKGWELDKKHLGHGKCPNCITLEKMNRKAADTRMIPVAEDPARKPLAAIFSGMSRRQKRVLKKEYKKRADDLGATTAALADPELHVMLAEKIGEDNFSVMQQLEPRLKPRPTTNSEEKEQTVMNLPVAMQPDQPRLSEKRAIIEKLSEVYLNEDEGYDVGWDDEKVSKDLGVPQKWVADIRADNFGPNVNKKSNELIVTAERLLGEARAVRSEFVIAKGEYEKAKKDFDVAKQLFGDANGRLVKYDALMQKLERDLADLTKRSKS